MLAAGDNPMVPSFEVFQVHGLRDVTILEHPDIGGPSRLRGIARYIPTPAFPTVIPANIGEQVHVRWIEPGSGPHHDAFRRHAQIIALDSLQPTSHRDGYGNGETETTVTSDSPSETTSASSIVLEPAMMHKFVRKDYRAGYDCVVLAWWEDEWGWWLLTIEEDVEELVVLADFIEPFIWSAGQDGPAEGKDVAKLCLALIQLANCFKAARTKGLALVAPRLQDFAVRNFNPEHVVSLRFDNMHPGMEFQSDALPADHHLNRSQLFSTDVLTGQHLDEAFIRNNRQRLSPELLQTRSISDSNDIYTLGLLAYEAIKGQVPQEDDDAHSDSGPVGLPDTLSALPPIWSTFSEEGSAIPAGLARLGQCVAKLAAPRQADRYRSLDSAIYDLRELATRSLTEQWERFEIGARDRLSTFALPERPVHRDRQLSKLEQNYRLFRNSQMRSVQHVSVWGISGSGKTRFATHWLGTLQRSESGKAVRTVSAAMAQNSQDTYTSVRTIASTLLEAVVRDAEGKEKEEWLTRFVENFDGLASPYLSLLPESTAALFDSRVPRNRDETVESATLRTAYVEPTTLRTAYRLLLYTVLRLVATEESPVIVLLDDMQWASSEELAIWSSVMSGSKGPSHLFVISTYRTTDKERSGAPDFSVLPSEPTLSLEMASLEADGVQAVIVESFVASIEQCSVLASLILAETGGLPIYVTLLLNILVRDKTLYFDFNAGIWRYNLAMLQGHLTSVGIQQYLEWLQTALPGETKDYLITLSLLPERGFELSWFAEAVGKSIREVQNGLQMAITAGIVRFSSTDLLKFTHDRHMATAYRLASPEKLAQTSLTLSRFLRRDVVFPHCSLEFATCLLRAWDAGLRPDNVRVVASLVLEVVGMRYQNGSFSCAMGLLQSVDRLIDENGGTAKWLQSEAHQSIFLVFLKKHTETSKALALSDSSIKRLDLVLQFAVSDAVRIQIIALKLGQLIACGSVPEMQELMFGTLRTYGFDLKGITAIDTWTPKSSGDALQLARWLTGADPRHPANSLTEYIMQLISFCVPTLFGTEHWAEFCQLIWSLLADSASQLDTTTYLLATVTYSLSTAELVKPLYGLILQVAGDQPWSTLTLYGTASAAALAHWVKPLPDASEELGRSYRLVVMMNLREFAAYLSTHELTMRFMSAGPTADHLALTRFRAMRPYLLPVQMYTQKIRELSLAHHILVPLDVQYCLQLATMDRNDSPWSMVGPFLPAAEIDSEHVSPYFRATHCMLRLRLATLYDASLEELDHLWVEDGGLTEPLPSTLEWIFLSTIIRIRRGEEISDIGHKFAGHSDCTDMMLRDRILTHIYSIEQNEPHAILHSNALLRELDLAQQYGLAGILSLYIARFIVQSTPQTGSLPGLTIPPAARTYLNQAGINYQMAGYTGPYDALVEKWQLSPPPPSRQMVPRIVLDPDRPEDPFWKAPAPASSSRRFAWAAGEESSYS